MIRPLLLFVLAAVPALSAAAQPTTAGAGGAATPVVETRDCLETRAIRSSRFTPRGDYYARVGRDWWRNTAKGCPFAPGRTMVWRSIQTRQCRGDIVEVIDARVGFGYGGCGLGNWERVAGPPGDAAS